MRHVRRGGYYRALAFTERWNRRLEDDRRSQDHEIIQTQPDAHARAESKHREGRLHHWRAAQPHIKVEDEAHGEQGGAQDEGGEGLLPVPRRGGRILEIGGVLFEAQGRLEIELDHGEHQRRVRT